MEKPKLCSKGAWDEKLSKKVPAARCLLVYGNAATMGYTAGCHLPPCSMTGLNFAHSLDILIPKGRSASEVLLTCKDNSFFLRTNTRALANPANSALAFV